VGVLPAEFALISRLLRQYQAAAAPLSDVAADWFLNSKASGPISTWTVSPGAN
jgi:hypothetical protein